MDCRTALAKAHQTITAHRMNEEQVRDVWLAFMNRSSISMTEPPLEDWTEAQKLLWATLWDSDLTPF